MVEWLKIQYSYDTLNKVKKKQGGTKEMSKVYFSKEITKENLVNMYG